MNPIMLYLIKQFYFYKTKRREHINVHAFFSKISFAKRVNIPAIPMVNSGDSLIVSE